MVITGDHSQPDPTKRGSQYNEEDMVTHNAMCAAFESLSVHQFDFRNSHQDLLDNLRTQPPDLVINFCDTGFKNIPTQELNLPAFMELYGIPYSGAPPAAMVICYDKAIVRLVAAQLGIDVPREYFLERADSLNELPDLYPALLKPNAADGSVGITKDAVVRNVEEARTYLKWMQTTLPDKDVLWQEYLPGAEYGIGVIGNPDAEMRVLPALEVDYSSLPDGLNPILSYESKAMPDSPYWSEIKFKRAEITAEVEQQLSDTVTRLFRRFGLRDYARFDFRVAADGRIALMEVNPNPAWANDGKLAFMASFANIEYRDMLALVLDTALARAGLA